MSNIRIRVPTVSACEALIVNVWHLLELRGIQSPMLRIRDAPDGQVIIDLAFMRIEDAAFVLAALDRLGPTVTVGSAVFIGEPAGVQADVAAPTCLDPKNIGLRPDFSAGMALGKTRFTRRGKRQCRIGR